MTIRTTALLLLISFTFVTCRNNRDELQEQITDELIQHKGTFAVAFKDLTTGEQLLINERELFHAASTMKVPVMIEVFKQANDGRLTMKDSIIIKNEFKSIVDGSAYALDVADDTDTLIYKQIGEKRAISSLVYDMITISSNLATNLLLERVGPANAAQTVRNAGAHDLRLLRGVEDSKAYRAGLNNQVTAFDLMLLFEKIAKEEMVSEEASQAMMKILIDQKFNAIIPAQLPADVKVAHKTGWITGLHHDAAVVLLPDGRKYVLVLLSKELTDEKAAIESLSKVSKMIYDYVHEGE